jgi:hypothetical protein
LRSGGLLNVITIIVRSRRKLDYGEILIGLGGEVL